METKKTALILYIICSILVVFAAIIGNDELFFVTKPIIIPAIFFYYLSINQENKVSTVIALILVLYFIGNSIGLLELKDSVEMVMIPYFSAYLLLIWFGIDDFRKLKFNKMALFLASLFLVLMFMITYSIINVFKNHHPGLVIPVVFYAAFLSSYGAIALYSYQFLRNRIFYYLLIFVMIRISSDVFYMIYQMVSPIVYFNYFQLSMEFLSYFFMVKYFVAKTDIEIGSKLNLTEI